jgi:hypothetical protein
MQASTPNSLGDSNPGPPSPRGKSQPLSLIFTRIGGALEPNDSLKESRDAFGHPFQYFSPRHTNRLVRQCISPPARAAHVPAGGRPLGESAARATCLTVSRAPAQPVSRDQSLVRVLKHRKFCELRTSQTFTREPADGGHQLCLQQCRGLSPHNCEHQIFRGKCISRGQQYSSHVQWWERCGCWRCSEEGHLPDISVIPAIISAYSEHYRSFFARWSGENRELAVVDIKDAEEADLLEILFKYCYAAGKFQDTFIAESSLDKLLKLLLLAHQATFLKCVETLCAS